MTVEAFGIPTRRITLHPAYAHQAKKGLTLEPAFRLLRLKRHKQIIDFCSVLFGVQWYKKIWPPKIPIIFRNLILENQMIPKRIPRKTGDLPMILVCVTTPMSEDDIRLDLAFQIFEEFFDLLANTVEKTIAKFVKDDRGFATGGEELRGFRSLQFTCSRCTENDPMKSQEGEHLLEVEQSGAASDFDVI